MPQIDRISIEDAVRVGVALHQDGHIEEAQQVYEDILGVAPDQPDALHFLGVLNHQLGESEKGAELISKALTIVPDNPGMRSNYGNVLKELGRHDEAEEAYRKVIELVPDFSDAHCNLGSVLRLLDKSDDAEFELLKAIKLDPQHGEAYQNLRNLYRDAKNWDEAIQYDIKAAEHNAHKKGKGKVSQSLATVLRRAGKNDQAEQVVREWFLREPQSPVARHMLAAFTGDDIPARASDEYVREVFDSFANSFDEALNLLHYRAPRLIAAKVEQNYPEVPCERVVLDAGCGTGFVGELLKPFASSLIGVDLSQRMLVKAKQKRVYDELVESELTAFLSAATSVYDLITCVDTFIYFGELNDVLEAAYGALKPGGGLYFTLEKCESGNEERGYGMEYHGRYQHRAEYVKAVLRRCGFESLDLEDEILRLEAGQPVTGVLVVAHRGSK